MISSNSPAEVTIILKAFLPCPLSCLATSLPQLWSLRAFFSLSASTSASCPPPCSCPPGVLGTFRSIDHGLKVFMEGLLWWLSGKESACQCRRRGFDPWSGTIPHALEQQLLSLCSRAWEPKLRSPRAAAREALEPVLHKRSHRSEKPMHHSWRAAPLATTREKPAQ